MTDDGAGGVPGASAYDDDEFDGLDVNSILELVDDRSDELRKQGHDSIIERAQNEQAAADALTYGLAVAVRAGFARERCDELCGAFAQSTQCSKGNLLDDLDERIEALKPASERRLSTREWIEQRCTLIHSKSSDSNQQGSYIWIFDGDARVESDATSGGGRIHFNEKEMQRMILATAGERPRDSGMTKDEWEDFVSVFISTHATVKLTPGVRTIALDEIQEHIKNSIAWHPIDVMGSDGTRTGVFIPKEDDPGIDGDENEVWVPSSKIGSILDDHDSVSTAALRAEMDAQGYTANREMRGVTERISIKNKNMSFWVFDREFAEPKEYITEADDGATATTEHGGDTQ